MSLKQLVSDKTISPETRERIESIQKQLEESGVVSMHFSWNYEQLAKDQPSMESVAIKLCETLEADLRGEFGSPVYGWCDGCNPDNCQGCGPAAK